MTHFVPPHGRRSPRGDRRDGPAIRLLAHRRSGDELITNSAILCVPPRVSRGAQHGLHKSAGEPRRRPRSGKVTPPGPRCSAQYPARRYGAAITHRVACPGARRAGRPAPAFTPTSPRSSCPPYLARFRPTPPSTCRRKGASAIRSSSAPSARRRPAHRGRPSWSVHR